jgi:hypothetical protein
MAKTPEGSLEHAGRPRSNRTLTPTVLRLAKCTVPMSPPSQHVNRRNKPQRKPDYAPSKRRN